MVPKPQEDEFDLGEFDLEEDDEDKKKEHTTQTQVLYADELHLRWKEFVQRVRIHEMLKCMQTEHKKMQILREHTDFEDVIMQQKSAEEELLATSSAVIEEDVEREYNNHEEENSEVKEEFEAIKREEDNLRKKIQDKQNEILNKGIDTLFVRTQAEEEEAIAHIYPPLKKVLADPKYVAKCAVKMFRTRTDITEDEFESIIELCQDKLEQQALRDAYEENKNRERYLHNADERRKMLYEFINSRFFVQFMLITIIVSIIGIFLLTFESIYLTYAFPLIFLDNCIIGIFVVEATFKITIYKEDYFKKPWNLLDILIILVNFVEVTVELITKTLALSTDINANIYFKILKSLRALRLLRVIKFLPNLQVIVTTVFQSMLSMGSIAVLMSLFIFVFAVMGRGLFAEDSPSNFGELWLAFVTLFQLLTLDDWFELMQKVPEESTQYSIMFLYLFFYIIIENFVFLNLFVAVLVDNFQLTLAATEIRKQKEALIYLEEKENFSESYEDVENKTKAYNENDFAKEGSYVDPRNPELTVPDYFPIGENSREKLLVEHIFKDFCALDFERFLWKRRLSIVHTIMDKAITVHRNSWAIQDSEEVQLGDLGEMHAQS